MFVPAGLHLMEGKHVVTNILLEQNQYLDNTISIPITGITTQMMRHRSSEENSTAADIIMTNNKVQSIERTRETDFLGKWLEITTKDDYDSVLDHLKNTLPQLYQHQSGQTRIITAGFKSIRREDHEKNNVSTYAEISSRKFSQNIASQRPNGKMTEDSSLSKAGKRHNFTDPNTNSHNQPTAVHKINQPIPGSNTDSMHDTHQVKALLNRIERLETSQANARKESNEHFETYIKQTKQMDNKRLADSNAELQQLEDRINTKLQSITEDNDRLLQATEERITQELKHKIDTKMNLFSDSVANKVSSQLLEAMHQYMNAAVQPHQIQGGLTDTPMITQEVASHSQLTPTKTVKPVVGVSAQVPGNGTLQVLQALEDITHPDTNLTFPRSNHDASNERIQTDT